MKDSTNTMVTTYDPSKPITKFFIQIDKGVKISDAENTPFTNSQIIDKAYILVCSNELYSEEWTSWDRHPVAEKYGLTFTSTSLKPKII